MSVERHAVDVKIIASTIEYTKDRSRIKCSGAAKIKKDNRCL